MSKTQTGRKKSVLWSFIYVVSFIVVFAASALIKMTVDPMGGAFKAEWNDSVGTVHTDAVMQYRYHTGKITHEKYFEWKLQWSFGSTITHSSPLPKDIDALLQNSNED